MYSENSAKAFVHCHSDHSLKDSPLTIDAMVQRAKEMNAKAITLTDHGFATGWIEFMNKCKEQGINGIPGVEAYIENPYGILSHLVLIAKNYEGFQELSRAITESNENLRNIGGVIMPIFNKDIITRNFGNGNVIATTACVSGIISTILLGNYEIQKKIERLTKQRNKYNNPLDKKYLELKTELDSLTKNIASKTADKNILENLAKKKYTQRKKGIESMFALCSSDKEKQEYYELMRILDTEIKETENAIAILPGLKSELKTLKSKQTRLRQTCKDLETSHVKYLDLDKEIKQLTETLPSDEAILKAAEKEMLWYKDIFKDNFYVEVQFHGLATEKYVMPLIVDIAKQNNIPIVATNDVHIAKKEDAEARATTKALRFNRWESPTEEDKNLYMKSDKELSDALKQIIPEKIVFEAMDNIVNLCNRCNVVIPEMEHFPKYKDDNGNEVDNAPELLRKLCYEQIPKKYPNGFDNYEQLEYELKTIIDMGYADYTLIVADYIRYAKQKGIENHPAHVAESVGPGRGSGAGSIVNFTSGITNIDPIRYNLKFERYLNPERVSLPDIDVDFSEEVREDAIAYVTRKYGASAVAAIRTCMTQGVKASIDSAARVRGFEMVPANTKNENDEDVDTEQTKEAIKEKRKKYQELGEAIKKEVSDKPGVKFNECKDSLYQKFTNEDAKSILNRAEMLYGTATSLSVHAAGIIIGDGAALKNYIPLLYNTKKKCWAVQCDMVEAEQIHLLKMDFLGLINLDIITECARRIKMNTGITIDLDNLPFEDEVFSEIFAKGNTSNVFQFESGGMKQMLREFQPETIDDVILLVAAYRPGPMDFIPDIIDVKHGRKKPHYVVPQLEKILAPTYGQPVYQEQLMDIFHLCAGFSLGEADIIRRYMSKKKTEKFLEYKPQFMKGFQEAGATQPEAEKTWDSLEDFSKYAFNKSHAAAYAVVSYQTAWLKYHYPVEFMCATLNHTKDIKKLPAVLYECKRMGITVLPPNINKSNEVFEDKNGQIVYGLGMIKGIKEQAINIIHERQANGRFSSIKDFLNRVRGIGKNCEKLIESGAFDELENCSRTSLLKNYSKLSDILDAIKKKEKQIIQLENSLESMEGKTQKSLKNARLALEKKKAQYSDVIITDYSADDNKIKLSREYELLGAYITGHPLDSYKSLYKDDSIVLIRDFMSGKHTYAGLVSNVKLLHRKSDGKEMAFFTIEDVTGTLEIACFPAVYEKYKDIIKEGNVLRIAGDGKEEVSQIETEEPLRQLVAKNIWMCRAEQIPYLISTKNLDVFSNEVFPQIKEYEDPLGHLIYLHNQETGMVQSYDLYVSKQVLDNTIKNATIIPLKNH